MPTCLTTLFKRIFLSCGKSDTPLFPPLRCGRRIAFPFGGTPPPARQLSACPSCILWQGILAGHLWSCRALLTGSWGLLRPSWSLLGRSWEPLGASWGALGSLLEPLGALLGGSWGLLGASWAVLEAMQNDTKMTCQKRSTSRPIFGHTASIFASPKGGQNRPKSDPRRVKI